MKRNSIDRGYAISSFESKTWNGQGIFIGALVVVGVMMAGGYGLVALLQGLAPLYQTLGG